MTSRFGYGFVQQFSIAEQIKTVCLEICPAIENCWTKPYLFKNKKAPTIIHY